MKKIIFINSHPIQYFAPLYAYLNKQGLSIACWYCSDETLRGHIDRQFGKSVKWDIPLLEGYSYRFFRNRSWKPSLYNGFFGLFNPGMIRALFKEPKSIIIIHGWACLTNILVIVFARLAGHTVCLRGESPLNQELLKSKKSRWIKTLLFRVFLFPFVHRFLFIGKQNKAFYEYYGVKEDKLVFVPYAVDNDRFRKAAELLLPQKKQLREQLGLPVNAKLILFTAKFIEKKRPMDLLRAYAQLRVDNKCLVMVGDGELRTAMQSFVSEHNLQDVFFPGFINQSEIVNYYAIADVFVMCSGEGETWGLSVNEAMNFNLPLVVSDIVGCAADLVRERRSGIVVPLGNISKLSSSIQISLTLSNHCQSVEIVSDYSYQQVFMSINQIN
ncbi:MAG TPA: glycosyltransferase family 4 protein [Cyclobacteriaceae bacterium]